MYLITELTWFHVFWLWVFAGFVLPDWAKILKKINSSDWPVRIIVLTKFFIVWPCGWFFVFDLFLPLYPAVIGAFFCGSAAMEEGSTEAEKEILHPKPIYLYLGKKVRPITSAKSFESHEQD